MTQKRLLMFAGVSTLTGAFLAIVALIVLDASLLSIPMPLGLKARTGSQKGEGETSADASKSYKAVTERNLFRARLEAEIPKPRSDKEIEEEMLVNILRPMTLKGVMTGQQKKDLYAVIDRGGQKGVWTYEVGEVIEQGLAVTDIRKDAVTIEKGDFAAILKLFAKSFERLPSSVHAATAPRETPKKDEPRLVKKEQTPARTANYSKEIKKEGQTTVVSKSLAQKMKNDTSIILSSVAIKLATDAAGRPNGYKVVSVENGGLAQKLGIMADDVLQEVNGYQLRTTDDTQKAHKALTDASKLEVKVLRRGKVETLRYEIR
jgi:type II secretory pathway component PulC